MSSQELRQLILNISTILQPAYFLLLFLHPNTSLRHLISRMKIITMSEIAKTWTANGSCLLCVPKGMANKFNILDSNVVLEDTKNGILIRRLELD
jgi:hypothetical protein